MFKKWNLLLHFLFIVVVEKGEAIRIQVYSVFIATAWQPNVSDILPISMDLS